MPKLTKISQIFVLAVFVLLLTSGCSLIEVVDKFKVQGEESWGKYTEITKEAEKDVVGFMKEGNEVSENDFIQEKIDITNDWFEEQDLNTPKGVADQLDTEWMPLIKEKAREAIDSVEVLLSKLIKKFNIGENN